MNSVSERDAYFSSVNGDIVDNLDRTRPIFKANFGQYF